MPHMGAGFKGMRFAGASRPGSGGRGYVGTSNPKAWNDTSRVDAPIPVGPIVAPMELQGPKCKICRTFLSSDAESRIGVHVSCIQSEYIRRRKIVIPAPGYRSGHR